MMFTFLYNSVLLLLALVASPRLLYQVTIHKKYRKSFKQRLGQGIPTIEKGDRPVVWIHAISNGETKAMAVLFKWMKQKMPHAIFVVSSMTETGYAEASRSLRDVDHRIYLPIDFSWIVKRALKKIKPDIVILGEGDLWYNFLHESKMSGAKVFLVNGKVSERSARRFALAPWYCRRLFDCFDLLCVQNDLYRDRFYNMGAPKEKVVVTGNLKFDDEYPKLPSDELQRFRDKLGVTPHDTVLVIGSSHDPEEKLFLKSLKEVWERCPRLKVLIVPRHPERFGEVASLISKEKIPFARLTGIDGKTGQEKIILIDAMGLLRQCYQLADVAIVAGSYTEKVGGHNILEPCWYGVPVIFGPYMHSQPDLVGLVESHHAGMKVPPEQLTAQLISLCSNVDTRRTVGTAGSKLVGNIQGATQRTWESIASVIAQHTDMQACSETSTTKRKNYLLHK